MSRLLKWDWKSPLLCYLTALFMGFGMALCVYRLFLPHHAAAPVFLLCAFFILLIQGYLWLPMRHKWLIPVLSLAGLSIWGAAGGGPFHALLQWGKTLALSLRGMEEAALPYAGVARWAVCFLFALLASLLAWDRALSFSLFSVLAVLGLGYIFGREEQLLLFALPAAAGILLMLSQHDQKRLAALPVAILIALVAFLLLPGQKNPVPALNRAATQIRQLIEDYLFFHDYRSSFSLKDAGYQPLDDRLGGEAFPVNQSAMEVHTDETVLLRGRTYNEYSGLNWHDTLSSRRYLLSSPRFANLRENLFDLARPSATDEMPQAKTIRVHMLSSSPTTLFVPQRTRTLQMESPRMVAYYNMAGELFITRNLEPGDQYTLSYLPFAPGDAATEWLVASGAMAADPYYDEAAARYLALPPHIQDEIYAIAGQVTWNTKTPYEKALSIQRYLQQNFSYSLKVKDPPEGVDFAAWFLLGEKTGYCTYFATAMTVLCRCAGIPARYVTGYIAQPDESGTALVTGKDAHAWTEVYLNGFGWLAFDPTPGGSQDGPNQGPDQGRQPTPPPASPSPAPSPTPAPSPSPEGSQEPTPSPEPENEEAPLPSPTPPPGSSPDTPDASSPPPFPWWLLLLLALALLALWRFLATDPVRAAARHPSKAVNIYFDALCLLLGLMKLKKMPQETYHDFARRADPVLLEKGLTPLSPLMDAYAARVYGKHGADSLPFREAYLSLKQKSSPAIRLRFILHRMMHTIQ